MAKIIIPQKKTATLEIVYNGESINIQFPVDSMAGYRQTTEVIKGYRQLSNKQKILTDEKLTEDESTEILDKSVGLMEDFREAVRVAIGEESYNKYLRSIANEFPFTAWVAILSEIIAKYTEYFGEVTSTKGEL
jgi:hypothetical protein